MKKRIISALLVVCMLVTLLPVIASAETKEATLIMASLNKKNVYPSAKEGGAAYYAVNTDDGLVTPDGASADNYTIKLEYPAGGTPTLYLKGAYINNPGGIAVYRHTSCAPFDIKIVIETDSKVEAAWECFDFTDGSIYVTGPGKLTAVAEGDVFRSYSKTIVGNITVENANLDLRAKKNFSAFRVSGGNITLTNSELKLDSGIASPIDARQYHSATVDGEPVDFKIDGWESRGNVTISGCNLVSLGGSDYMTSGNGGGCSIRAEGDVTITSGNLELTAGNRTIMAGGNITISGGNVVMAGKHFTRQPIEVGEGKTFKITGGTVEISCMKSLFTEYAVPNLNDHPGFTAVAGTTKDSAATYNPDMVDQYKYFKLTDGDTVVGGDSNDDPADNTSEETVDNTSEETNDATTEDTKDNDATEGTKGDDASGEKPAGNNTAIIIAVVVIVLGAAAAAAIIIIKKKKAA